MTDKNESNVEDESDIDTDEQNSSVENDVENESTTDSKEQNPSVKDDVENKSRLDSYDDVQILGALFMGLIVLIAAVALLGGGGVAGDFDYPEWADENGITINDETAQPNFQAAIQGHTEAISTSSYTINIDGESSSGDGASEVSNLEYKYNSESQTSYAIQNMNDERIETYDEFVEQRQLVAQGTDEVTYDRQPLLQPTPFTAANEFVELMSALDVEATSTTDGGDVVVYEVQGVSEELSGELDMSVGGEIHLHTDGYFTYMNVDISDNEQQLSTVQEISVTDVGSTDVVEPEWYSEALEQTEELEDEDFEPPEQEGQPPQEGDDPVVIE